MPSRKKSKSVPLSAADIANIAKTNPYVQRLVEDPKLRKNVREAIRSSRNAYGRFSNGKVVPMALLEDKKLHSDLARALAASRDAAIELNKASRRRVRRRLKASRVIIIAGIGGGIAIVSSEKLRSKVLDVLFGAEEEFQYTPPATSTPAEPTSTVGAA